MCLLGQPIQDIEGVCGDDSRGTDLIRRRSGSGSQVTVCIVSVADGTGLGICRAGEAREGVVVEGAIAGTALNDGLQIV